MITFSKEQIKEISEELDCGFRAFYHKQKADLIFVPDTNKHINIDTAAWQDELDKLDKNFQEYQEIYAMETSDLFHVMAAFAEQLTDTKLKNKLASALNMKNPFREFKFAINHEGENRQSWFHFKNKRYIEWTEDQLKILNRIG